MIIKERYGLKDDGNTVIETSTYIETTEDHPLAEQIEGVEGFWVRVMVGNALVGMNAKPVSHARFLEAQEEMRLRLEAIQEEVEQRREQRNRELAEKRDAIRNELTKLGLSTDTVTAILNEVKE